MAANRYSGSGRTPAATAGATLATLHTGANLRAFVVAVGFATNAATDSSLGLIAPSNTPVASTSLLGQAQDPAAPASTVNVDTAWSTAPTVGTIYRRRHFLPSGAITSAGLASEWCWWEFEPIIVAVSSYLVLWNFSASTDSACDVYFVWYEAI